jgi:hypothetical protein
MRLALIVPVTLMMGMLYGCTAGSDHNRPQPAFGSYDERQHYPAYKGQTRDPAYSEGQRSQALEGNTR